MLDFYAVPSVCMIPELYVTNIKYLVDFLKAWDSAVQSVI